MENDVRVEDRVRKTVVFVGRAHNGAFSAVGTAFIGLTFIGKAGFQQLVTAKHVIDMIGGDVVHVRANRIDGRAEIIETDKHGWWPHPDKRIDVSICPTHIPREIFDIVHLPLDADGNLVPSEEAIRSGVIGIGDEIFMAGMYVSRIGEQKNIPIIRGGIISAMPEETIGTQYGSHHAYLIETRSFGGLSGSPVFAFHALPFRQGARPQDNHVPQLIGMLVGHHQTSDPSEVIEIADPNGKADEPETAPIPLNTGVGIVLPIANVIDAVNQADLRAEREKTLKEHSSRSGYVADSAAKSS
jgi:hypothetical protein